MIARLTLSNPMQHHHPNPTGRLPFMASRIFSGKPRYIYKRLQPNSFELGQLRSPTILVPSRKLLVPNIHHVHHNLEIFGIWDVYGFINKVAIAVLKQWQTNWVVKVPINWELLMSLHNLKLKSSELVMLEQPSISSSQWRIFHQDLISSKKDISWRISLNN